MPETARKARKKGNAQEIARTWQDRTKGRGTYLSKCISSDQLELKYVGLTTWGALIGLTP